MLALAIVGKEVGSNWHTWKDHLQYLDYAVLLAIVALIVWALIKRTRGRANPAPDMRGGSEADAEEQPVS